MAQLVKLQDYISRYEKDIYHYPAQYIRLKNENWKKLLQTWEYQLEEQSRAKRCKKTISTNGNDFFSEEKACNTK